MKQSNLLKIIGRLQEGPATVVECVQQKGCGLSMTRRHFQTLRSFRPKLVYVCGWESTSNWNLVAVYAWGNKPDVKRPPKMTAAERQAKYRVSPTGRIQRALYRQRKKQLDCLPETV